jgi:hypothetical protein
MKLLAYYNTIRPAAMFLVWIVFTVAAKVITSRGKCILSVFSPVIPNTNIAAGLIVL